MKTIQRAYTMELDKALVKKLRNYVLGDDIDAFNEQIESLGGIDKVIALLDKYFLQKNTTTIHVCAEHNSVKIGKAILEHDKTFCDRRDMEDRTALHIASIFGWVEFAELLLEYGCNIDCLKKGDWSALVVTVTKQNYDLTYKLLMAGADLTLPNNNGWTVFHLATSAGDKRIFNLLLDYVIWKNMRYLLMCRTNNGRTLMHIACLRARVEIVEALLAKLPKEDVASLLEAEDRSGDTPFLDAVRANSLTLCKTLIEANKAVGGCMDVHQKNVLGRNALHAAAETDAVDVIEYLVRDLKIPVDSVDRFDRTALRISVSGEHTDDKRVYDLLISLGASQMNVANELCMPGLFATPRQYIHLPGGNREPLPDFPVQEDSQSD